MRSRHSSRAFTLIELVTSLVVMGILAVFLGRGLWAAKRLQNYQRVVAVAHALDQAQIEYLATHPGGSLSDPAAADLVRTHVQLILETADRKTMSDSSASLYLAIAYDVTHRPATCTGDGVTVSFPIRAGSN